MPSSLFPQPSTLHSSFPCPSSFLIPHWGQGRSRSMAWILFLPWKFILVFFAFKVIAQPPPPLRQYFGTTLPNHFSKADYGPVGGFLSLKLASLASHGDWWVNSQDQLQPLNLAQCGVSQCNHGNWPKPASRLTANGIRWDSELTEDEEHNLSVCSTVKNSSLYLSRNYITETLSIDSIGQYRIPVFPKADWASRPPMCTRRHAPGCSCMRQPALPSTSPWCSLPTVSPKLYVS